jgi:hypothetical protein
MGGRRRALRALERALVRPAEGRFGERELDGLPEPARRLLGGMIAPETPLATAARLSMRGEIRLKRWTPFSGHEVLAPRAGFVWSVRAGAISGYDRYVDGEGEMRWYALGLVPVMRASGPDVSRSAAGRAAGEAIWLPTALLARHGVAWRASGERELTAGVRLDAHAFDLHYRLDEDGRIASTWFERWGDPDGTGSYGPHRFGIDVTAHRTFGGLTIPSEGVAGWHHGSKRWPEGAFFRYELTGLELLGADGVSHLP